MHVSYLADYTGIQYIVLLRLRFDTLTVSQTGCLPIALGTISVI